MTDTVVTERPEDLWRLARRTHEVRTARALAVGIVVGLGTLMLGSFTGDATGTCATPLSCARQLLPAPITITTGRVGFRLARDGTIGRVTAAIGPFRPGVTWFPATGTWYRIEHRHLDVGLGRRQLWRSHGQFTSRFTLGVIVASSQGVAFQHDHKLYLAPLDGVERPVALREAPLGWTAGGLYTYAYQGRRLLLRSDSGALVKVIARRGLGSDYEVTDGRLYFTARGVLMSADGARTRQLDSLTRLGMATDSWLQPVGPMAELEDNRSLVVIRANGSVFARTPLPRSGGAVENISSSLVAGPGASAVAFTAAAGQQDETPTHPSGAHGTETVYLLRPGERAAMPLFRQRVEFRPCERGANIQWHRGWLLYTNSEGNVALIDSAGTHRAIELTGVVGRLLHSDDGFSAYWGGQPSGWW
jgi:hypothetical protein